MARSGSLLITSVRNDFTSTNITTSAYVELVTSLGNDVNHVSYYNSSGQSMELAYGASGAEQRACILQPGDVQRMPLLLNKLHRISAKALSGDAVDGELTIEFYY